ncbi:MAG TPA: hypothetical protein VEA15_08875 [Caulobacteraceae bacterium]|nr:hypothetical protein [Caulobacteraceae bacterium]
MSISKLAATCAAAFSTLALLGSVGAAVAVATATPAVAEDRRVRIINGTRHIMVRFYASNSSRTSWEEDILGRRILKPGESVTINIDDGSGACLYDFKAVFDDGDELTRGQVNVCKISEYRYTE